LSGFHITVGEGLKVLEIRTCISNRMYIKKDSHIYEYVTV